MSTLLEFGNNYRPLNQTIKFDYLSANHIFVATVILFTAIFGLTSNALIIFCFHHVNQLKRQPTKILIQNLGIQDIIQNVVVDIIIIVYVLSGDQYVPSDVLCKINYTACAIVFPGGYWCIFGISFIRFCHCKGYSVFYKYRKHFNRFLLIWSWITGAFVAFLGDFDVLKLQYDNRLYVCIQKQDNSFVLTILVYSVTMYLPLLLTCLLNAVIYFYPGNIPLTKEQRSVLRSVIVIFICMIIFHLPFILVMIIPQITLPKAIFPWITVLGCMNSSLNALVYGWYSTSFRRSICMIFSCRNVEDINRILAPRCRLRYVARKRNNLLDIN